MFPWFLQQTTYSWMNIASTPSWRTSDRQKTFRWANAHRQLVEVLSYNTLFAVCICRAADRVRNRLHVQPVNEGQISTVKREQNFDHYPFVIANRELKQRGRHLKMQLCVSAIISQLFRIITLAKYVLTVLELNWNQRFRWYKRTKLNICHHMLTSSTQPQNKSFYVVERTRTSAKC